MTAARDPRPTPVWPPDYSSVDLRLDASPSSGEGDQVTRHPPPSDGDLPSGGSDVAKLVGGGSASLVVFAVIDKILSDTGISAADVAAHLGPMLGAFYNTYPVVALLVVVLVVLLRRYRLDQATHRWRDRQLQNTLKAFGRGIKSEIEGLRSDVAGFSAALENVKAHVEARLNDTTRNADGAIVELRGKVAELNTRMSRAEIVLRLDRGDVEPHPRGDDVPTHARRIGNGRSSKR